MPASAPILEVDGLSKHYTRDLRRSVRYTATDIARELVGRSVPPGRPLRLGEFAALDDVSFTLHRGDALAVIGANGAGKSTLLKLLHGLIKPDRGEIRVRGRLAALIELGTGFDPVLTGRENIAVNGAILGVSAARLRAVTDEIVAFAELEHAIDAPVRTYSSGMTARLAFAVAAHLEPDVLLVDEVLAVGDLDFQRKCGRHMHGFLERGGSLILVSHNTYQVQSICRRGLLLEQGRCTFAGSTVETVTRYLAVAQKASAHGGAPAGDPHPGHPVVIDRVTVDPLDRELPLTGEPLRVEVACRSLEARAVVWGFSLWTADGWVCVTGAFNLRPARLACGAGRLSCTIPRLPLVAGRYQLRTAILEADTSQVLAIHGYQDAPTVLLVNSPATVGYNAATSRGQLVTLDVDWD